MSATNISERYFAELCTLNEGLESWKSDIERQAKKFDSAVVVSGRVKSHRSVIGKVYRKAGVPRTWESLGDLVALKAVFPTDRGARAFTDWVSAQSHWSPILDAKPSAPDQLKYQSNQFDLKCAEVVDASGQPLKVELQVRTAVADAWYVVDHRLRYKGTVELPETLKRKLYRLIVLTELFDEEVEAVLERQAELPEYVIARLYEQLTRDVDALIDGYAKASRPEGLLELVLTSYTDEETEKLSDRITEFLSESGEKVGEVIKDHLHDSGNFVELRDWLYYEPETLLIAERAATRPLMISNAIRGSDFEPILEPMISEFKVRLGK